MNIKTEIVALAVRLLADKTNLIHKPDTFELFLNSLMGVESYDRRLASEIIAESDRAVAAVKRKNTDRKFKKIVQNETV